MGLTKRKVDAAKPKKKGGKQNRTVLWDKDAEGGVPGFGVRAYAGGKKSYVIRYRNAQGKERLLTLGSASVLTVGEGFDLRGTGAEMGTAPCAKPKLTNYKQEVRRLELSPLLEAIGRYPDRFVAGAKFRMSPEFKDGVFSYQW